MVESSALEFERELIAHYREIGQCKCNFHDGGNGGRYEVKPKKETSKLKRMHFTIQRSKMGIEENTKLWPLRWDEELALKYAMEQFDFIFSNSYYELSRNQKLLFCEFFEEAILEVELNKFIEDLVEQGAYHSEDDFWEQQYKY